METNTANANDKTTVFLFLGCSFSLLSFIGGLIIGLAVLGWLIWPVQWVDAKPTDLRHEYQLIYIDMVVDSFEDSHDLTQARYRLHPWENDEALQLLGEALDTATSDGTVERVNAIQLLIDSYESANP